MADFVIPAAAHMHFSSSGAGTVTFGDPSEMIPRTLTNLILTVSGSATISFDGGENFMPLLDGTYQFVYPHVRKLYFGTGTWAGVGISV